MQDLTTRPIAALVVISGEDGVLIGLIKTSIYRLVCGRHVLNLVFSVAYLPGNEVGRVLSGRSQSGLA